MVWKAGSKGEICRQKKRKSVKKLKKVLTFVENNSRLNKSHKCDEGS